MPRIAIRFAASALADLEALRLWYAEQAVPDVGERLLREIVGSIEALADHPEMGRVVPEFDQPYLRELVRPPYRIVYRRDPGQVRIVRVWPVGRSSKSEGWRAERLLELPKGEPP